ncbi:ABC transporter ATP-binding protein [Rhizobiaceae bacterium BDR2-2]|uniref:ABC transporter ATP-binding protein n=1 Tax=Ectorhizobium quercum TaxID=2965071 RepID=A0AAE3MW72_9HYPH|nr:ABC transporter ATP-binding protein [Ectorhizobium quercum]MCX8996058.1 ABC transporter ATP-binding protein [Ectorhizobium quercum]
MKLELSALGIGYGRKTIGDNISLSLAGGEVLALLGPNGAGKTTLFKTILGLLPIRAGEVILDGKPLAEWSRRERALRIAYVPQAHETSFPFTVRDVVLMGRTAYIRPFATPGRRDREITETVMESVGIVKLADAVYTEISGGERQLTLIARALAQQARIVVMDEPASSLDYGNQMRLLAQIRQLARAGLSVVLSTHNPDHAFLAADRVALLKDGGLHAVGAPDTVLTPEAMKTIYGIDVVIGTVAGGGAPVCSPRLDRMPYRGET